MNNFIHSLSNFIYLAWLSMRKDWVVLTDDDKYYLAYEYPLRGSE